MEPGVWPTWDPTCPYCMERWRALPHGTCGRRECERRRRWDVVGTWAVGLCCLAAYVLVGLLWGYWIRCSSM